MNVLVKKAHIIIYYTDILKGVFQYNWFAISSVLFLQVKTFFSLKADHHPTSVGVHSTE